MTRSDAYKAIREHEKKLSLSLDDATSQFQIRIVYVTAHEELVELARKIIKSIPEDDHK